ncbi:hypothetical protein BCR41DRAFT_356846 [Lobosporangium transversale]|uniref:FAD-binding PCMH-type domain-containing protein n=1 Tax=Lobosporangium transversale TaxID=64571 RepID=A0A1Y2GIV5_9FUNG|nr:hypothetical protein BCR41DRAFT_357257 [Lobosporangium transversale]XP_021879830.1 hypothetical protein BCR41DRAFT_356846 [Lobosporangium transversale]ORZ10961.1 hypothetical protein BCR41DRAFT_357257 [Lobosporangium transversale]ORZ11733.1 hypothetical protein BCR41DRAFT_356846 [Lobosporangium transversale]|eukprot:XP_021879478.1 hypothetical protein BCR41DRAFT_357257 [Lobosporangium transversale]
MRFHRTNVKTALILYLCQSSFGYYLTNSNDVVDRQDITPTAQSTSLATCLKPLGSKVLERKTTAFENNRYAFDLRYTFNPQIIVMAFLHPMFQTAVKCAKAANIADGSLVVDLSGLSSVTCDRHHIQSWFRIRLGPLYLELFNKGGWTINAGTCPSVGIGGHALGGGFGLLSRKYGLLIDRIVEMEMVDANGNLLLASATQNPDLFYALRGAGGGSYGVVTSFTIQPIKPPPVVTYFSFSWGMASHASVLRAYVNFQATASRDVGVEMNISPDGLELYGIFQGARAQMDAALSSFFSTAPKPLSAEVQEGRQIDANLRFAYVAGDPKDINALGLKGPYKAGDSHYTNGKSLVYSKPLTDSTIGLLGKWAARKPIGAIPDTPVDATSFVHLEWDGNPDAKPGKPDCQDCLKWMNDMYSEFLADYTTNYGPVRGYQNYIDKTIPNWQEAYYGSALPRLKQIKAATDPTNVFRFPQSIPLQ